MSQTFVNCPECDSVNIYRWFCGEYTCQECHKLFGECEEIQNFTRRTKGVETK